MLYNYGNTAGQYRNKDIFTYLMLIKYRQLLHNRTKIQQRPHSGIIIHFNNHGVILTFSNLNLIRFKMLILRNKSFIDITFINIYLLLLVWEWDPPLQPSSRAVMHWKDTIQCRKIMYDLFNLSNYNRSYWMTFVTLYN